MVQSVQGRSESERSYFVWPKHINMCWDFQPGSADRFVGAHLLLRVLHCAATPMTVSSQQTGELYLLRKRSN